MSTAEIAERAEWMEAPTSPLSDAQVKGLAQVIVNERTWQPNECYLTRDDSLCLWGEVAYVALEELRRRDAEAKP